jgi:hypothetical protein
LASVNENTNSKTQYWAEKTFNVVRNASLERAPASFAAVAAGPSDQPSESQKIHNGIKGLQSTLSKVVARLSTLEGLSSLSNAPAAVTTKRKSSEEPEENPSAAKKAKTTEEPNTPAPAPTTPDNQRYAIGINPDFKHVVGSSYNTIDLVENFKAIIQRYPNFRENNLQMITSISMSGTGDVVVAFKHTKDTNFLNTAVTIIARRLEESFPGATSGSNRKVTPRSKVRVMNIRYFSLLQDPKSKLPVHAHPLKPKSAADPPVEGRT